MSNNEDIFVLFRKTFKPQSEIYIYIYIDRFGFAMQSVIWCQTIPHENTFVLEIICNYLYSGSISFPVSL